MARRKQAARPTIGGSKPRSQVYIFAISQANNLKKEFPLIRIAEIKPLSAKNPASDAAFAEIAALGFPGSNSPTTPPSFSPEELRAGIETLPQELCDMIIDSTLACPIENCWLVKSIHRPPAQLQVCKEFRRRFSHSYYGNGSVWNYPHHMALEWFLSSLTNETRSLMLAQGKLAWYHDRDAQFVDRSKCFGYELEAEYMSMN